MMIYLYRFWIIFLLFSATLWAKVQLKVGDVLLQPLSCWACSLIEAEEETIYSHIGVVLAIRPEVLVAEAFGRVRKVSLVEFDKKTQKDQRVMVLRFKKNQLVSDLGKFESEFVQFFEQEFEGAKYDHDFRWNNVDENGREKYYCSELLTKLFFAFLKVPTPIKRMHFQKNRESWMKYFKGNIPDNEWGNSPADFERSELFIKVGEL